MSLKDLVKIGSRKEDVVEITEEVIKKNLDKYREIIAYWRIYPDRLIDFYCGLNPHNTFHLYFYQRMFLRVCMRHKMVYATFVRAWSKSFMSVLSLMLKAILYPNSKLFTVAAGKERKRLLSFAVM